MSARPELKIPESPELPFPLHEISEVISGFGRGSADLGIPTANIPVSPPLEHLDAGIYFGWCKVVPRAEMSPTQCSRKDGQTIFFSYGNSLLDNDKACFPMVMSIGWNPFYNNRAKTAEVHVIHKFSLLFYGASIELSILGYIRPELDYTSKGTSILSDILHPIPHSFINILFQRH